MYQNIFLTYDGSLENQQANNGESIDTD